MSAFWKSYYRDKSGASDDRFVQVGKTVDGSPVGADQLEIIAESIALGLDLGRQDCLIDAGCGNGLLTELVAAKVGRLVAVDQSAELLEIARATVAGPGIDWVHCEIPSRKFRSVLLDSGANKLLMYEVLQHLDEPGLSGLLGDLSHAAVERVFIGGIPDSVRLESFYDTTEKLAFHHKMEALGKPHLGQWWLKDRLESLCNEFGFAPTFLSQSKQLYTSHYRFDLLLSR